MLISDPKLVELLQQGAVGVIPTDTIYGVVCRAADETAVKRLYQLKSRENKPGTIIAANIDQLVELGIKYRYVKAVEHLWPNPLSIVIPSGDELAYLHLAQDGLACRIPSDKHLKALLEQTGALLTSSANHPGEPPANTVQEAEKYFTDQVDFYADGGDLSSNKPSTLIRIVDDEIEVLREGAVTFDEMGKITT